MDGALDDLGAGLAPLARVLRRAPLRDAGAVEGAEAGDGLPYPWYQLPLARLAKGYSWVVNRFDAVGPVPAGMSARAALRNGAFSDRQRRIAARVAAAVAQQTRAQGYPPPYWTLLDLARAETRREP